MISFICDKSYIKHGIFIILFSFTAQNVTMRTWKQHVLQQVLFKRVAKSRTLVKIPNLSTLPYCEKYDT